MVPNDKYLTFVSSKNTQTERGVCARVTIHLWVPSPLTELRKSANVFLGHILTHESGKEANTVCHTIIEKARVTPEALPLSTAFCTRPADLCLAKGSLLNS